MYKIKKWLGTSLSIMLCLLITGCSYTGRAEEAAFTSNYENTDTTVENIYVSSADVMYKGYNPTESIMDFYVLGTSDIMSLSYDGATVINDKYGSPMSVVQLQPGDIAKIAYNSTVNKVGSVILSDEAFTMTDLNKYSISVNGSDITIGDSTYSISSNVHIFSSGSEISLDQIIDHDELTIQGVGHDILSIRVDDGHGYLELSNEEALIGGWIEVGQTVISQVMENMLFTVPEGEYTVRLTNTGIEEYRDVSITRNNITTLDLSDIVSATPEKGIVSFSITPSTAVSYVDGSYVDTYYSIRLPVGVHEITCSASGYSTVTQYFEVTGLNQLVTVDLETATATSSVSGNNVNKNLYANMIIEAPVGAEVYEDNIYKGIVPVTYQKTAGTHTLTFRKTGYDTVSYNVVVYDDGKDQTFSFPEMTKTTTVSGNSVSGTVSGNTVSGNTVSGNTVSGNSTN